MTRPGMPRPAAEPAAEPADAMARFAALLAPEGQELLGRLREAGGSATDLGLGTDWRAAYPVDRVVDALAQHELRLRARAKFSRAMDMYFTRAGLEQASAEVTAGHRLARYTGAGLVADLCCGIGGDLTALAAGRRVLAIDRDPLHLRMALANAGAYGVPAGVTAVAADVRDVSLGGVVGSGLAVGGVVGAGLAVGGGEGAGRARGGGGGPGPRVGRGVGGSGLGEGGVDAAFIDRARRAGQRRLRAGDSEPPLAWCLGLADTVARTGIKAAPGLPRDAVPPAWELEFIAVGRDLKEAVAWSPALATAATRATVLPGGHTLTPGPGGPVPVRLPGGFLLDPSPAVTRAGVVE